jgi:hypothetical protein
MAIHTKIELSDWAGNVQFSINVPQKCDKDLKLSIIRFFLDLDDHDGIDALREIWDLDKEKYDELFS